MFGSDLRQRVDELASIVAVMARNQRSMAEALRTVVESANANADHCNRKITSIVASLQQIVDRLAEDASDDWWKHPHD
jgi:methyl-accepting chemotaxis protein